MRAITVADLPLIAKALASKSPDALQPYVTGDEPPLQARGDGTYHLSRPLYALSKNAAKNTGPEADAAKGILEQALRGQPSSRARQPYEPARANAGPARDEDTWLSEALAAMFFVRSYGFDAARTMVGPLIDNLARTGRVTIRHLDGGVTRLAITESGRTDIERMRGQSVPAMLLAGILASDAIAYQASRSRRPEPSTEVSVRKIPDAAQPTPSSPSPEPIPKAAEPPAPAPQVAPASGPALVPLPDPAPSPKNAPSLPQSAPPRTTPPQSAPPPMQLTETLTADQVLAAILNLAKGYTGGDAEKFRTALTALTTKQPEVNDYIFGNPPLIAVRPEKLAWTDQGAALLRDYSAQFPNDPKVAGLQALVTGPSTASAATPTERKNLLKSAHKFFLEAIETGVRETEDALHRSNPEVHAALFQNTTEFGAPLLKIEKDSVVLTPAGTAALRAEAAASPSRLTLELATYFGVSDIPRGAPATASQAVAAHAAAVPPVVAPAPGPERRPAVQLADIPAQSTPRDLDLTDGPTVGL